MSDFHPRIDQQQFKDFILKLQNNEGNNVLVVNTINKELQNADGLHFFEQFIFVCKKYHIEFFGRCVLNAYEIIVLTNGMESHKFVYHDSEKDITRELSNILYDRLFTQVLNKTFVDEARKNVR